MNKLAHILLVMIIVASLVLAGCSDGSNSTDRHIKYRTGSQSLFMQLVNPATEDFVEGDSATILVEYFNKGTSNIVNGEFFVSGYDLRYMTLSLDPKYINIEGKSEYDPNGRNSQILSIRSSALKLPENSDEFPQTIKVIGCYEYATLATAEICVDPDPYGTRITRKTCTMSSVSPGPQGAPLVVTRVEPIVSKEDFRLLIDIANQGTGVVYNRRISNWECFTDLDKYEDKDKVDLIKVDFSGRTMDCKPTNPLRLIDGHAKVSCECKGCLSSYMDAYKTQISIEFKYGYRNEIMKSIRVLKD